MAIVRASCPSCGDVEMGVDRVDVRVCVNTARATYSFACAGCLETITKPASDLVVESLETAGAVVTRWTLPAEVTEVKSGPPINHDDLLEFHLALESDNWYEELASIPTNG